MRTVTTWRPIFMAAIVTLVVSACGGDKKVTAPVITAPAAALASGIVGTPVTSVTITATGTAPITFSVSGGALTPGLTLSPAGLLSGTPTTAGNFSFTVSATNAGGVSMRAYTQSILQAPVITAPTSPLAPVTGGSAFPNVTFTASGSSPITWSVTAGTLPPGTSLNAAGVYSGTPSVAGSYSFTVTATNAAGSDSDPYTQLVTAPAVNAHALFSGNRVAAFATSLPSGIEVPVAITGIAAGETLVSIDRRPQNGFLYGLAYNAIAGTVQLYSISSTTALAAPIGPSGTFVGADGTTPVAVGAGAGTTFGIDFNPTVDRVRVVNSAGQNFRMNPNTGAFIDGNAAVAGVNMDGAINGSTTSVQETAYTNNAPNSAVTTQYTLDFMTDALCIQNPPNAGTQTLCQTLSSPVDAVLGLDIAPGVNVTTANAPAAGSASAVVKLAGQTAETLANINLTTGVVNVVGTLGGGGIAGIAVQQPAALPFVGLSADGTQLLRFGSSTPGTASTVTIAGVAMGESLVGIDYRPQSGQLYAFGVADLTNTGTLYLLDPQTGAATVVGSTGLVSFVDGAGLPVDLPAASSGYGFDFNPTVDRIRVTTQAGGLNFRINPNNGTPVDGNLNNTVSPPAGVNTDGAINGLPGGSTGASGAAYTNSFGQSLTGGVTTQYVIDAASNSLYIQNPPNAGTVSGGIAITLGGQALDFSEVSGFDIPSDVRTAVSGAAVTAGSAYAALTVNGAQRLFAIDLVTGQATELGAPAALLSGLAAGQSAVR